MSFGLLSQNYIVGQLQRLIAKAVDENISDEVKLFDDYDDGDSTLFLKTLGDNVTLPDVIEEIARELTLECYGQPLAIVTMARSMRGKTDIREWRNTVSKL